MKPQTPVQRARLAVLSAVDHWSGLCVRYYREPGTATEASVEVIRTANRAVRSRLRAFARAIRAEERKQ